RGQRLGAALEVDGLDLDARLLELAELLREHGRQVAQAAGTADRQRDLGGACGARRQHDGRERRQQRMGESTDHGFPPNLCTGWLAASLGYWPAQAKCSAGRIAGNIRMAAFCGWTAWRRPILIPQV